MEDVLGASPGAFSDWQVYFAAVAIAVFGSMMVSVSSYRMEGVLTGAPSCSSSDSCWTKFSAKTL